MALVDFTANNTGQAYTVAGTLAPNATATFDFISPSAPITFRGPNAGIGSIAPANLTIPFTIGGSSDQWVEGSQYGGANYWSGQSDAYFYPKGINTISAEMVPDYVTVAGSFLSNNRVEFVFTNGNALAASFNAAVSGAGGTFGQLVAANSISVVPLPSSVLFFAMGFVALGFVRLRRRKVS